MSAKRLEIKKERIRKTLRREQPDKVPFLFAADTYIPFYAGVRLQDITTYDKAVEVCKSVAEELNYDCVYLPYMPQNLLLAPKLELLGGGTYILRDNLFKQINPDAVDILKPDEYPQLIKDPLNFLLDIVYPRRFKTLGSGDAGEKFKKLTQVYAETLKARDYFSKAEEECGTVVLFNGTVFFNPIDLIFDGLRGFNIVSDIRKKPEQVRDAGLAMVDSILKFMSLREPIDYKALFCPMHLPSLLKPSDFEKVYWPSFKSLADGLSAQGHNIVYYFEADYSHLYEYLQELPKTHITGIFEKDDIRVVKKKLGGTMTVAGGLSRDLLSLGTKEQCIDMTKALIDDLAPGGGYFIAPESQLTFLNDANPVNLRAVSECINTYGIYQS